VSYELHDLTSIPRALSRCGVLVLPFLATAIHVLAAAEQAQAAAAPSPLTRQLMGTWVHVGEPGKVGEAPAKGGFIKLRTERHWAGIVVDPRSGIVTSTHGGTWRVNGGEYEETVDYGGDFQAAIMGKTWRWKLTLEGDTMTKIGINTRGTKCGNA